MECNARVCGPAQQMLNEELARRARYGKGLKGKAAGKGGGGALQSSAGHSWDGVQEAPAPSAPAPQWPPLPPPPVEEVPATNALARRSIRMGGYDEAFSAMGYQDIDFARRMAFWFDTSMLRWRWPALPVGSEIFPSVKMNTDLSLHRTEIMLLTPGPNSNMTKEEEEEEEGPASASTPTITCSF